MKKILFLVPLLLYFSIAYGQPQSYFDVNDEGWKTIDGTRIGRTVTYVSAGNPKGYIETPVCTIVIRSCPINVFFSAPPKFFGNFSSYYNGSLSYDLKRSTTNPLAIVPFEVEISNGIDTIYYFPPIAFDPSLSPNWKSFAIPLTEKNWRKLGSKTDVPKPVFESVLSNLKTLNIKNYSSGGSEIVGIDNVILQPQPLITATRTPICESQTEILTTSAAGVNLTYQWQVLEPNGQAYIDIDSRYPNYSNYTFIATANGSSLNFNTAGKFGDGNTYRCKVLVNGVSLNLTNAVLITVNTTCGATAIESKPLATQIGGIATLDLVPLVKSNKNRAIDISSLSIVTPPASGGVASINAKGILSIDYKGLKFSGKETLLIKACDIDGSCAQQLFTIEVGGEIVVYNALSPDGNGKNDFLFLQFIDALSPKNQVSIYNRWGDEVFTISDYNNDTRKFSGLSSSGSQLPVGTYFYKISLLDAGKTKTGYLEIKY
jgi:gliding motility-associated-like protein